MIRTSKLRERGDELRRPIRRRGGRKQDHGGLSPDSKTPEQQNLEDADVHENEEENLEDALCKQVLDLGEEVDLAKRIELILNLNSSEAAGTHQTDATPSGDSAILTVPATTQDGAETPGGDDTKLAVPCEEEKKRIKSLRQRGHVTKELVDTEHAYVKDLKDIVEGYMEACKTGPLSEGMRKIIFGNISQIYEWHKRAVVGEIHNNAPEPPRLGRLFVRWRKHFSMYVKYCENKPKSEFLVAEYASFFEELRQESGSRLDIGALLIKPVQRLMKYQLLLKDMLRYSLNAGEDIKDLMRALEVMKVVPKQADDMMSVARIEEFPGNIMAQGAFLLQDTLKVMAHASSIKHGDQKFHERRVFLFDQSLIIAEKKKNNNSSYPRFIYKSHIMINKMGFNAKGTGDPFTFTLINRKRGPEIKFQVQAPNAEVYQNWTTQIKSILDMQSQFLLALQFPGK